MFSSIFAVGRTSTFTCSSNLDTASSKASTSEGTTSLASVGIYFSTNATSSSLHLMPIYHLVDQDKLQKGLENSPGATLHSASKVAMEFLFVSIY